jgi:hypothetical protein
LAVLDCGCERQVAENSVMKAAQSGDHIPSPMEPMSLEGDDALRLYYAALARNLKAIDHQFADLRKALAEWTKSQT